MSVTGTGIIFILLGLYGLFFNNKFLYVITVFFIPFTATAVLNIGNTGEGSAIQPYMFFGLLWCILIISKKVNRGTITKIPKNEAIMLQLLFCFLLVCLLSIFVPAFITNKVMVNQTGAINESVILQFSSKNVSQFIYLLYGGVFSVFIYRYNRNAINYNRTVKIYIKSILFVVAWGYFQYSCNFTGIPYPDFIFNNSASKFANGYLQFLDNEGGLKRISSVAVEPSVMVQSVLISLPFLIFSVIDKKYIFSRKIDISAIILIITFVFMSTSSGGILGILLIGILSGIKYLKLVSKKKRAVYITLTLIGLPLILFIFYQLFTDIINAALFNKADSYSAIERWSSIQSGWSNFIQYPILGLGWGSVSSLDLVVKLLSNTGIIGLIVFLLFILKLIFNHYHSKEMLNKYPILSNSIIISFYVLLFSNAISGFSYVFGYFWLVLGLFMVSKFENNLIKV